MGITPLLVEDDFDLLLTTKQSTFTLSAHVYMIAGWGVIYLSNC